eukprot:scaffold20451_cov167-Skeletonema_dohrnii-CCMP3373.AAC.1
MREGPITDGLVNITTVDADEFNNFYIMGIPFVTYDDAAATERKVKREFQEAKNAAALAQATVQHGTQGVPSLGATANSQTSTASTANSRELEAFQKNIKMDASTYPILSDDAAWHAFNQEWTALCVLYNINNVLDPNYIPPPDKVDLFKAHQSFLMTVMMAKIKTTRGKEIVRSHVANNDAQAAWKDLVEYYRGPGSILSKQRGDDLYARLNTAIPGDKIVRLTHEISEWEKDYAEFIDVTKKTIYPDEKLRWFERFVGEVSALKSVSTMHSMIASVNQSNQTTTVINPEATINLYKSRAEELDIEWKKKAVKQRRRIVNELSLVTHGTAHAPGSFYQVNVSQLIDTSLSDDHWCNVYLASQGEVPSNRVFDRLPKRVWDSLTKEEQQIWDTLSPATKSIIINCRLQSHTPIRPITHRRGPPKTNFRREARNNPNSAGRNPQSPIAQAASINAIEKLQDVDVVEALQDADTHRVANLAAITDQLDMPTDVWTDEQWNDDLLINSLRRDDAIDVNQTSQFPPFSMERFLSQPDSRASKPGENNEDVLEARHTEIGETDADCDDDDDGGSSVVSNLWSGIRDAVYSTFVIERDVAHDIYRTTYSVSPHCRRNTLALVDRGANGGVGGGNDDVRLISTIPNSSIDIQGMDNHTLQSIPLGSVGGVAQTQRGEVILIFHQYAILRRGRTIHSAIQLENKGNQVSDTAIALGGQQRILTPSGYSLPLDISNGLACLRTRPFTDDEWNRLPRVEMTSNEHWNPRVHDANAMDPHPDWHVNQADEPLPNELDSNALGEYIQRISAPITGFAISDNGSNAGIAERSIVPLDLPSSPPTIDIRVTDDRVQEANAGFIGGGANDIMQQILVNFGENGSQRNHLSELLRSLQYRYRREHAFRGRILSQPREYYIQTDNVAVNHEERSRLLPTTRRVEPALTDTIHGDPFADSQTHLYLDDIIVTRAYRYVDDETIQVVSFDLHSVAGMNPQDPSHNVD